jgi:hypothetical protein
MHEWRPALDGIAGPLSKRARKEAEVRTSITLVAIAIALVAVPGAFAERLFVDPAGDSGAAPDITGVRVSHDPGGAMTLAVATSQPTLAPDASIWGFFDTDRNAATGLPARPGLGADVFFIGDAEGGVLFRVNGNLISIDFDSSFSATYAAGIFTARLDRSELGTTDRFTFLVQADQDDANGDTVASDFAPDGAPFFEYSLTPLTVTLGPAAGTPKLPAAGKRFVVAVKVTLSDAQPFASGSVTCAVRAGKVALRPVGSVASGTARCAMKVPRGTAGRMLRGSLTVGVEGSAPVSRSFALRIR